MGISSYISNRMGAFKRLLPFNKEQRSTTGYKQVTLQALLDLIGISSGDVVVNKNTAMRIAAVFSCVLVRAESLASIPFSVMQDTKAGTVKAYSHPVHYLLKVRPNKRQTAADFWKTVSVQIDLEGESIAIIKYSGRMIPVELKLVKRAKEVEVFEVDDNIYYRIKGKVYHDWEVLHFKDLSIDGERGMSKIEYNAKTVGYSHKLANFADKSIGVKPPGYFTTTSNPNGDAVKALKKDWNESIDDGEVPLLPFGLDYKHLSISPQDAQYLDSKKSTKEDICGIFRVPPSFIQDYGRATWANSEQQDLVFTKYTMTPTVTNIEQECNYKLFSEANKTSAEPFYVKGNMNALLRGDFKSRTEGYKTLFDRGLINGDMVAELEDWNKWEGGDRRFVPMNMVPLDRVDGYIDKVSEVPKESNNNDENMNEAQRALVLGFLNDYQKLQNNHHA